MSQEELNELKKKCVEFLQLLEKEYPHQEISEYTRTVDALEELISYGVWEEGV